MKKIFSLILVVLSAASVQARVQLPDIISDNMVLQQKQDVALWGTAEPNSKIDILTSWDGKKLTVSSDKSGTWKAYVKTPAAGGPYTISFDDGDLTVVNNVLIGEVWLCSGQSNMVMPMKGYQSQPVENAMEYVATARPSQPIRVCTISRAAEFEEKTTCRAEWCENTPAEVSGVSATAYLYARRLQEILDVPVGVVVSAWGGSKIEAWMSRQALEGFSSELNMSFLDSKIKPEKPNHAPAMLYNGMLAPIRNYNFKGVIWYQGCSNVGQPDLYFRLQPVFVNMLRNIFRNPSLPFYYVQIAPFKYKGYDDTGAALLREAQSNALKEISHSGMVVTMDCGDNDCIHPAKKRTVADRLAFLALQKTYGMAGIDAVTPLYESHEIREGKVYVKFTKSIMGIGPKGHQLDGFEVAGADKVFHPASAQTGKGGHTVVVYSENVPVPVAVRYAFRNCSPVSVYNTYGIPASPFRTDDWEE